MIDKYPCPIPETHRRLNQAYSMFEEIAIRYQEPDKFTTTLNDSIQALRNITFILQSEKDKIPNFDKWYERRQEVMRNDEVLKWLVEARNHVVKRGDLEKKSYMRVGIKDHLDQLVFSKEFNPFISLEYAASSFRKNMKLKLPKYYDKETILEVERKWIIESYSKAEITDVLIYCFACLTNLIYDAHLICEKNPMDCRENIFVEPKKDFMISIRNRVKRARTISILYKGGRILHTKSIPIDLSKKMPKNKNTILETARSRYGIPQDIIDLMNEPGLDLPFNYTRYHIEMAKHLFKIDGYLVTVAFLYFQTRSPIMMQLHVQNPEDRYLMMEQIAEKIEETHCEALVFVGEIWTGKLPKLGEDLIPPRLQEDRKEYISIVLASPEKTEDHIIEIIRNSDGTSTLGEEVEMTKITPFFLSRIYKIWNLNRKI